MPGTQRTILTGLWATAHLPISLKSNNSDWKMKFSVWVLLSCVHLCMAEGHTGLPVLPALSILLLLLFFNVQTKQFLTFSTGVLSQNSVEFQGPQNPADLKQSQTKISKQPHT